MNHHASPAFRDAYRKLPPPIQLVADKCFELLRDSPRHPSLHFKPVGVYWSIRIGRRHRALGLRDGTEMVWFWVGSHADYDRLVRARR